MTYNVFSGTLNLTQSVTVTAMLTWSRVPLYLYMSLCDRTMRWYGLKRTSNRRRTSWRNFRTVARHTESFIETTYRAHTWLGTFHGPTILSHITSQLVPYRRTVTVSFLSQVSSWDLKYCCVSRAVHISVSTDWLPKCCSLPMFR